MTQVPKADAPSRVESRRIIISFRGFRKWLSNTRLFSYFSERADTRAGSSTGILDIGFPRRTLLRGGTGAIAAASQQQLVLNPAGTTETLEMALTRLIVPIQNEYFGRQIEFLTFKLLPCIHHTPSEVSRVIIEEGTKDPDLVASALDFLTRSINGDIGIESEGFKKVVEGPLLEAICSPELPPAVKDKIASKPNVRKFLEEHPSTSQEPQRENTSQSTENTESRERTDSLIDQSLRRDIPMMLNYFHRALESKDLSNEAREAILEEIDKRREWLIEIEEALEE